MGLTIRFCGPISCFPNLECPLFLRLKRRPYGRASGGHAGMARAMSTRGSASAPHERLTKTTPAAHVPTAKERPGSARASDKMKVATLRAVRLCNLAASFSRLKRRQRANCSERRPYGRAPGGHAGMAGATSTRGSASAPHERLTKTMPAAHVPTAKERPGSARDTPWKRRPCSRINRVTALNSNF